MTTVCDRAAAMLQGPALRRTPLAAAVAALLLSGTIDDGHAQARPSLPTMSCAQAAGLVASQGSVTLGTGPFTYERYVAHGGFCPVDAAPAYERTADRAQCLIGYVCRSRRD